MINKAFDLIDERDLLSLIENAVIERIDIDYKQALPSNSESDKKEFLADVSSFANAAGGDLIFGISENREKGIPDKIIGLELDNIDKEKQRLDSIIRDGLSPRLPSVNIREIKLASGKFALLIRIQQSWTSPHMVIYQGSDKFFSRNSSGKHRLNVDELRDAFNLSETLKERVFSFRNDRVMKIISGQTPVMCYDNPKVIVHLMPLFSFRRNISLDIQSIAERPEHYNCMQPIFHSINDRRYNYDGYLTISTVRDAKAAGYFQLFRNGIIEATDSYSIKPFEGQKFIPSVVFEKELMSSVERYLKLIENIGLPLPIYLFLSLIGIRDYVYATPPKRFPDVSIPFNRDDYLFPEYVIQDYREQAVKILRPCFDSIWNAAGFPRDEYYNDSGEWREPRQNY